MHLLRLNNCIWRAFEHNSIVGFYGQHRPNQRPLNAVYVINS